ncbi:MAG: ankyrin repeat domain-containing protein [Myxococcales bacterium]|nr:ankyrin repeat domain-containing protein [Myxococcales bacterium]USN51807.1 MAG: ankyrin repeat domain-containing protein [Myxococcales bacterium]
MRSSLLLFYIIFLNALNLTATDEAQVWKSPRVEMRKKIQTLRKGDSDSFKKLLAQDLSDIDKEFEGLTLLQHALDARKPNCEIIKFLLHNKCNPNAGIQKHYGGNSFHPVNFYEGYSACHIAVRNKVSQEILQILWEYGGDFFREDKEGWTPLKVAQQKKLKKVLKFFNENNFIKEKNENSSAIDDKNTEKFVGSEFQTEPHYYPEYDSLHISYQTVMLFILTVIYAFYTC